MNQPDKHHFLSDELFLRVIETEIDSRDGSLPADERHRYIRQVSERLQAEFEEHLMTGDLRPETVNMHIRIEVERALGGTDATAA